MHGHFQKRVPPYSDSNLILIRIVCLLTDFIRKKIVLAWALLLVAFTGNFSLKGSILVNTVLFADLPDRPVTPIKLGLAASKQKLNANTTNCADQIKTTAKQANSCALVKVYFSALTRPLTP